MLKNFVLFSVEIYQKYFSPVLPSLCRFHPTCSEYTRQAILKYGLIRGLGKGAQRIILCHPFSRRFGDHPLE